MQNFSPNGVRVSGGRAAGVLCILDKRCLLLQRSKFISFSHYWCLPGGWLNEGEESFTGAMREAVEEMGQLPESIIFKLKTSVEWNDVTFDIYVMRTPMFKPELDWESEGYGWFTFEEAMALPLIKGASMALLTLREKGVL